MNLFWMFLDESRDPPEWIQYTGLLNVLAITMALVLALVCTFYSALDYDEMARAQLRYSWGADDKQPLVYANPLCLSGAGFSFEDANVTDRAQNCVDFFNNQNSSNTEFSRFTTSNWKVPDPTSTNPLMRSYPYCEYPCFDARPIDDSGALVSGNYSFWWYSGS